MDFDNDEDQDPDYTPPQNTHESDEEFDEFKATKSRQWQKRRFTFNKKKSGVNSTLASKLTSNKPYDFFQSLLDDKFIQRMVDATNEYACMCKENNQVVNSWIQPWRDTSVDEMKKFIGIIIWMGLVRYPTLNSYWCRSHLYTNSIINAISRSQFQLLSHMWRLGPDDDRSADMVPSLLSDLRKKFKQMLNAPEVFAIEKVFIPSESESEGMNILFSIVKGGYIHNFEVYNGKRLRNINVDDAMNLIDGLLDKGRTLCTNEDITSMKLAKAVLGRKTNLVGLLNPNSKHIPPELRQKRIFGEQTETFKTDSGILIRKYNPFTEQYLLTTRTCGSLAEYYKQRTGTTIPHELKINNLVLMNSMNWYQKFAVEMVINTCLVNACYLYRKICTKKISSIRFMEDVIIGLLDLPVNMKPSSLTLGKLGIDEGLFAAEHVLTRLEKPRRCAACYERNCREAGRKIAMNRSPKAPHECCVCKKPFCLECFFKFHTGRLRKD